MAEEEKILAVGESHETPHAITITIMDPSALESSALEPSLVTTVRAENSGAEAGSVLVVSGDGRGSKDILQTVTETHMGAEELPIISNISNPDHDSPEESADTKLLDTFGDGECEGGEEGEEDELSDLLGVHCLICNMEIPTSEPDDKVPVFKTQTTTTHRRLAIFLGTLIGHKLTARKAHSDIMCRRCFSLLDRVDALEVEIRETKDEIVNKYQETVAVHGGRARRRKPALTKKSDYVFPKVEPEDEDDQMLGLETDGTFEPRMEDLMEEEHDRREDINADDEEWEPDFKRQRIKREIIDMDTSGPPKRKRGRPRKDASRTKSEAVDVTPRKCDSGDDESSGHPACPVCTKTFHFHSQLRRHVRYEHPDFDTSELDAGISCAFGQTKRLKDLHMEVEDDGGDDTPLRVNLSCSWCDMECDEEDAYDQHLEEHSTQAYSQYLKGLRNSFIKYKCYSKDSDLNTIGNQAMDIAGKDSKGAIIDSDEEESNEIKQECLKCFVCVYTSQKKVEMEHHMDSCHEDRLRSCALCEEICPDSITLRSHLVHHYSGIMECPVCPVKFSIKKHLLSHLKNFHSSGYEIPCEDCSKKFADIEDYEAHLAQEHGKGAIRTCEVCEKEIMALDFEKHLSVHEAEASARGESLPHVCNFCQATFMFITQLYLHKQREHSNFFPFQCNECERTFRTGRMLMSHRWGHKYGSHQCPACRLKYRQVDQLKRHLLTVHPELEGYSCKFCPIILKNYSTYVAHLKFKHPKEAGYDKRPVRCTLCGESFAHKVQWKYHMRNHSRAFQKCDICGISVKNLEIHMNLHTKEKKFECGICGAIYHNKASFHFHVKRVHMGEEVRKHLCDVCQKVFLTPSDLRIHMSRVHYGERNYWCSTCNKGYKSKVSLTYHQRLHTGERPHQCNLCGRAFRVPSYLKRHMEHDHRAQYTGVYFKQGRPKNQDDRSKARRLYPRQPIITHSNNILDETSGHIPEVVQITVPMEMGREVISSVATPQDLGKEHHLELEQGGVVYVVYEN